MRPTIVIGFVAMAYLMTAMYTAFLHQEAAIIPDGHAQNQPESSRSHPTSFAPSLRQEFSDEELANILQYAKRYIDGSDLSPAQALGTLFPEVDVVITWVNGSDAAWLERRQQFSHNKADTNAGEAAMRWTEHDELRFAIRSVWKNAPWVRRIHVVTSGERPSWLDPEDNRVVIVSHEEIWKNASQLPNFNSVAIESQLQWIPGVADKYIALNDDFMFPHPIWPHHFWNLDENGVDEFVFYQISRGVYNKPNKRWVRKGGYYAHHGNVYPILDNLVQPRNDAQRPGVPFHIPEMVDRRIMQEMLSIPQFAEAVRNAAASRFRNNADLRTLWAYELYLLEWPRDDADRKVPFEQRELRYKGIVRPQEGKYKYWSIGKNTANETLSGLHRSLSDDNVLFWCLNDCRGMKNAVPEEGLIELDAKLAEFLGTNFPKAPWEEDE